MTKGTVTFISKNSPLTIGPLASVHVGADNKVWAVGCNYRKILELCRTKSSKENIKVVYVGSTSTRTVSHDNKLYADQYGHIVIVDMKTDVRNCHKLDDSVSHFP